MRKGELCPGTQPVGELGRGVEAAHAEDPLELGQGVEVLRARGARGQGAAGRQLIDAEPGLQVVEKEAHLGLGPHPDDAHAQRLIAVGVTNPLEPLGQIRSLEVVQCQRVDDRLVGGRHGPLIHAQDQPRPGGALEAMRAEPLEVLTLSGSSGSCQSRMWIRSVASVARLSDPAEPGQSQLLRSGRSASTPRSSFCCRLPTYAVSRASKVPRYAVETSAVYRDHVNGKVLLLAPRPHGRSRFCGPSRNSARGTTLPKLRASVQPAEVSRLPVLAPPAFRGEA